jgi:hypothetical protein
MLNEQIATRNVFLKVKVFFPELNCELFEHLNCSFFSSFNFVPKPLKNQGNPEAEE